MREVQLDPRRPAPSERSVAPGLANGSAPVFSEGFGICLGGRKFYLNVRVGVESRSRERLAQEGQVRVSGVAFLYLLVCSGAIMLFGTLCMLYMVKSGLGIDLSMGESVLHPLYELIDS